MKLIAEVTRSYRFPCVFASKFWEWAKERLANLFYFILFLICFKYRPSLLSVYATFTYSWSCYSNFACLIDYESWLIWMLFCSSLIKVRTLTLSNEKFTALLKLTLLTGIQHLLLQWLYLTLRALRRPSHGSSSPTAFV